MNDQSHTIVLWKTYPLRATDGRSADHFDGRDGCASGRCFASRSLRWSSSGLRSQAPLFEARSSPPGTGLSPCLLLGAPSDCGGPLRCRASRSRGARDAGLSTSLSRSGCRCARTWLLVASAAQQDDEHDHGGPAQQCYECRSPSHGFRVGGGTWRGRPARVRTLSGISKSVCTEPGRSGPQSLRRRTRAPLRCRSSSLKDFSEVSNSISASPEAGTSQLSARSETSTSRS